jgi:methanogenic corrinoid protein MtbC1
MEEFEDGYRIAQVEQLTGVGAHTLRAWERRYGVPVPDRSGGRQRMYSATDVEMVRRMRELSLRGVPLTRAAELAKGARTVPETALASSSATAELLAALLRFDEPAASAAWARVTSTNDLLTAFETVLIPVLHEVGEAWHRGEATVAQEHFVSNFIRARLDALSRQVHPLAGAPVVLLACLEGEQHELGLLMLAVLLRFNGLATIYLGRDVPVVDLVRTVEDVQPRVAVLHACLSAPSLVLQAVAPRLLERAPRTAIVFGGGAFDTDARLRAVPGARYGGPTLSTALALTARVARARTGGIS